MDREEQLLRKRLLELAGLCCQRGIPVYTDFLTLHEQTVFHSVIRELPAVRYELQGGYPEAERKIVCFIPLESYVEAEPPITALHIYPASAKFASPCTHRDYLGAVLGLGIERSNLGDLIVDGSDCRLICLTRMAAFICRELSQAGRNRVKVEYEDLSGLEAMLRFEETECSVASVRLDSIVAAAFRLSRNSAAEEIRGERVLVNGKITTSVSYEPSSADIISVRGKGKARYLGEKSLTRKGRILIRIQRYR